MAMKFSFRTGTLADRTGCKSIKMLLTLFWFLITVVILSTIREAFCTFLAILRVSTAVYSSDLRILLIPDSVSVALERNFPIRCSFLCFWFSAVLNLSEKAQFTGYKPATWNEYFVYHVGQENETKSGGEPSSCDNVEFLINSRVSTISGGKGSRAAPRSS